MLDPKVKEAVVDLSAGNPGAINVLMASYHEVGKERFLTFAANMQRRGIRGARIWENFKDVHGQDIEAFISANTIPDRRGLVEHTRRRSNRCLT